ncbi:hypothetical protein H9Q72_004132 [Fusarium xylarioides]|uniref:RING-type domain-containing protein n=1 Tax=Fusarium xylarioides TaxID=221167 RepID=A0A9P7HWQ8_9HYPO|nr:hypothetical protein H9Q72_004132 [Fusarium xylarioides]
MEPTNAGLDLEKELTCSICTELLYQPLTLLDCLHTFCGACLKEWFTFQAATAERAPNPPAPGTNIFTCPACRATVRTTQHNATVVTLLDMFIAASPGKDRLAAEKEEMAKKYKPGDQVLPTINTHRTADERRIDAEDRRLVEEVRELSLQEAGVSSGPLRTRRRRESRSADDRRRTSRDRERDRGRDRSVDSRHQPRASRRPRVDEGGRHSSDQLHVEGERRRRRSESRQRQIEHQSSIRSLISSGDMSERDIEREIESFARQIQEEGLLDGLDLDNIDLSRDDELSRRITEAYRRRQRDRTRQETRRNNGNNYPPLTRYAENAAAGDPRMLAPEGGRPRERSRPHSRSASAASAASAASQTEEQSRPPTSTTSANLEVQEPVRRPRRRTASGGRSSTTPVFPTTAEPRPAARSSTDLGSRPQASDIMQSRPSFSEGRSTSTPIHTVPFPNPTEAASFSNNTGNMSFASRQGTSQSASVPPLFSHHDATAGRTNRPRPVDLAIVHQAVTSPISSPTVSGHPRTRSQLYPEPAVSCSRCNKQHIEYELHYNCSICANGQWNVCLNCYRAGKGCHHWFGFGHGAFSKWEKIRQQKGDASLPQPHTLTALRYRPPRSSPGGADGRKTLTTDDPRHRLESGTFCAKCSAWTNECYWREDHARIPYFQWLTKPPSLISTGLEVLPDRPVDPRQQQYSKALMHPASNHSNTCHSPQDATCVRSPSNRIKHDTTAISVQALWYQMRHQRQISPENGHLGWRRCLNGHRMVVIAFTDGKSGRWRYIAQDLVGGQGLKPESAEKAEHREKGLQKWVWHENGQDLARLVTKDVSETAPSESGFAKTLPPDGGVGLKATARFGWYPRPGADDELLFPKGAEIKEIEDVNGEWFFGAYMGTRGLFPAPYVRLEQDA